MNKIYNKNNPAKLQKDFRHQNAILTIGKRLTNNLHIPDKKIKANSSFNFTFYDIGINMNVSVKQLLYFLL